MDGPGVFCPQCGAPAPFRGTLVTLVCEYCGSTIVRDGVDIALVGKVSALVDNGSPVLLGSRGRWRGVPFEIIGRLQGNDPDSGIRGRSKDRLDCDSGRGQDGGIESGWRDIANPALGIDRELFRDQTETGQSDCWRN